MSIESPNSDSDFLDLLRAIGPLSVAELAAAMEVTPTAVRQRLTRMMNQGILQREAQRNGRGRPLHRYTLTDKGLRLTGSNFTDLAMTLWTEIRSIDNPEFRREMLRRIAHAMAVEIRQSGGRQHRRRTLAVACRFARQTADFGYGR